MKEEISTKISHVVPEEHCMHLGPKPSSEEKCRGDCFNSTWHYSDWSDVSIILIFSFDNASTYFMKKYSAQGKNEIAS